MSDDSEEFDPIELDCDVLYYELRENIGSANMLKLMGGIKENVYGYHKIGQYPDKKTVDWATDRFVVCGRDNLEEG